MIQSFAIKNVASLKQFFVHASFQSVYSKMLLNRVDYHSFSTDLPLSILHIPKNPLASAIKKSPTIGLIFLPLTIVYPSITSNDHTESSLDCFWNFSLAPSYPISLWYLLWNNRKGMNTRLNNLVESTVQ